MTSDLIFRDTGTKASAVPDIVVVGRRRGTWGRTAFGDSINHSHPRGEGMSRKSQKDLYTLALYLPHQASRLHSTVTLDGVEAVSDSSRPFCCRPRRSRQKERQPCYKPSS